MRGRIVGKWGRIVGVGGGGGWCRDWSSVFAIGRDRDRVHVHRHGRSNCNCCLIAILIAILIATCLIIASASDSASDWSADADGEEWSEWQDVYSIDETSPWYNQGIQFE